MGRRSLRISNVRVTAPQEEVPPSDPVVPDTPRPNFAERPPVTGRETPAVEQPEVSEMFATANNANAEAEALVEEVPQISKQEVHGSGEEVQLSVSNEVEVPMRPAMGSRVELRANIPWAEILATSKAGTQLIEEDAAFLGVLLAT